jgi:hypothetical protein
MNKQEFEQMLISDLFNGYPGDVTKYIDKNEHSSREEILEEILEDMMHTFAVFEKDPVRMRDAMKRVMMKVVNELVESSNLDDEWTDEDYRNLAADNYYLRFKEEGV